MKRAAQIILVALIAIISARLLFPGGGKKLKSEPWLVDTETIPAILVQNEIFSMCRAARPAVSNEFGFDIQGEFRNVIPKTIPHPFKCQIPICHLVLVQKPVSFTAKCQLIAPDNSVVWTKEKQTFFPTTGYHFESFAITCNTTLPTPGDYRLVYTMADWTNEIQFRVHKPTDPQTNIYDAGWRK